MSEIIDISELREDYNKDLEAGVEEHSYTVSAQLAIAEQLEQLVVVNTRIAEALEKIAGKDGVICAEIQGTVTNEY